MSDVYQCPDCRRYRLDPAGYCTRCGSTLIPDLVTDVTAEELADMEYWDSHSCRANVSATGYCEICDAYVSLLGPDDYD